MLNLVDSTLMKLPMNDRISLAWRRKVAVAPLLNACLMGKVIVYHPILHGVILSHALSHHEAAIGMQWSCYSK